MSEGIFYEGIDFYVMAEEFLGSLDDSDTSLPPRPMDVKALGQLLADVYKQGTRMRPTVDNARILRIAGHLLSLATGARRNSEKVPRGE